MPRGPDSADDAAASGSGFAGFPLKPNTAPEALLKHLNLLDGRKPTNAAVLLFGSAPQRFHRTAEIKCVFSHGTAYRRPFASQQIYGGDLFE